MACDTQQLLDDNACLYTAPTYFLDVAIAVAWCGVNGNVPIGPTIPGNAWFNPDVGAVINNPDVPGVIVNPDI